MSDMRCEHQSDLMPRHVVCLTLTAVILVLLGLYLGAFDLGFLARELKPSPHHLEPPKIERPSTSSP